MAFHNVPPNGFPDIPDIADLEAVQGEVNVLKSDVNELRSGLTNVDVALSVPENSGKNVLPYPFSETTKTVNGVTFTDNGNGTISTSGQATERTIFYIKNANANLHIPAGIYTVSKSYQNAYTVLNVDGYNGNTWVKTLAKSSSTDDVTITVDYDGYDRITMYLEIGANINTDNLIFKPMIRPATITDATFAPYIPSVESRIEAVESGLANVTTQCATTTASITINEDLTSESWYPCVVKKRNGYCYLQGVLTVKANKSIAKGDIILTINDESFRSNQNTGVAMVVGSESVYPFLILYNGDVKYMGSYTIQPTVAIQLNALWDARG